MIAQKILARIGSPELIDVLVNKISSSELNSLDNNYYKGVQYKVVIEHKGQQFDIGDGGFVDWTQQLLQNKKERMFTTGIGVELLWRLMEGKL